MTMTDDRAARLAALRSRRATETGTSEAETVASGRTGTRRDATKRRPAARSRSFVLGAAIAGTSALASNMWSAAAASSGAAADTPLSGTATAPLIVTTQPSEQIIVRIIHRPGPEAASVRRSAPSVTVAAAPEPAAAATAPAPQPAPQPVTRSRGSG